MSNKVIDKELCDYLDSFILTDEDIEKMYQYEKFNHYTEEGILNLTKAILREVYNSYVKAYKYVKMIDHKKESDPSYVMSEYTKKRYRSCQRELIDIPLFYKSERFKIYTLHKNSMTCKEIIKKIKEIENL